MQLINVRRGEPALEVGELERIDTAGDLLTYIRRDGESAFLVALNFGSEPQVIDISDKAGGGRITLSTGLDRAGESVRGILHIHPDEGLLLRVTTQPPVPHEP